MNISPLSGMYTNRSFAGRFRDNVPYSMETFDSNRKDVLAGIAQTITDTKNIPTPLLKTNAEEAKQAVSEARTFFGILKRILM